MRKWFLCDYVLQLGLKKSSQEVKALKKYLPEYIIFLAGGPHPSGDPVGTLRAGFDYIVIGEGEKTICDFMKSVLTDGDISKVEGIGSLKDEKFRYTGKQEPIDLNDYPSFSKKSG